MLPVGGSSATVTRCSKECNGELETMETQATQGNMLKKSQDEKLHSQYGILDSASLRTVFACARPFRQGIRSPR